MVQGKMLTTRRLFVALLALALWLIGIRQTIDPDLWWHLRTGELIWGQGIPRVDTFSFTVPGREWIAHEWLSQWFMWLVYRVGGLVGLIFFFALLVAITFMVVYWACSGRPYLAAFVVLLAALTAAPPMGSRPQMFNLFFLALFVWVVEGVNSGRTPAKTLWFLIPLSVLWANFHSGYLTGIFYLAAHSGATWLEKGYPLAKKKAEGQLLLPLVTIGAFLAAALNPNGFELWRYPFQTLGSQAMQSRIPEWQSPDFHIAHFRLFAGMMGVQVMIWVASRHRPGWAELLLFFGTGAAGLNSSRNIPLFAIVNAPSLARHLATLWPALPPARKQPKLLSWVNGLLLLLGLVGGGLWFGQQAAGNDQAIAAIYPVAAVDYLQATNLAEQPGYNSYPWGGYLIWRGLPVFVDGRADLYGDDFLFYYVQTIDLAEKWQEPLQDYQVAYVLIEQDSNLARLLTVSPDWEMVFADDVAAIFVPR